MLKSFISFASNKLNNVLLTLKILTFSHALVKLIAWQIHWQKVDREQLEVGLIKWYYTT